MLNSQSVQDAADMAIASHLSSIQSKVPFLHFFDGFRTSHEYSKIEIPSNEELLALLDLKAVEEFRASSLNPMHGFMRGTVESSEIYFQNQERAQEFYNAVPDIVEKNFRLIENAFGRAYHIFDYVGHPAAELIIVMMSSGAQTVEEYIRAHTDAKVGLLKVRLFRPWSTKHFLAALPKTTKRIAVLDRMKEFGAASEPLFSEVCTTLNEIALGEGDLKRPEIVVGGRFGLGGKEFTPSCAFAVYENLRAAQPKNHFTVGIVDDVCHSSLPMGPWIDSTPPETTQCMFWGLGSDGTVGANHDAIKIIGDNTDLHVQGYFAYDAHKSGGVTISHLRFGKHPIQSEYLIKKADYLACHLDVYVKKYKLLENIKDGGIFVLNSAWSVEDMEAQLPGIIIIAVIIIIIIIILIVVIVFFKFIFHFIFNFYYLQALLSVPLLPRRSSSLILMRLASPAASASGAASTQ
jgi:pyruvate-ferredoxin/flavodoxin oxidoreductase